MAKVVYKASTSTVKYQGSIDVISSSGTIEGWAKAPEKYGVLKVGIKIEGKVVAAGQANRFRRDLLDAGVGHGWYGYRLQAIAEFSETVDQTFQLFDLDADKIILEANLAARRTNHPVKSLCVADICSLSHLEPTQASHLDGISDSLEESIRIDGLRTFVGKMYCYVLGRNADFQGLEFYTSQLQAGLIKPIEFLHLLFTSTERTGVNKNVWKVRPPSDPGFPFASIK